MTRCPRCRRPAVLVNGAWVCSNPQCPGTGQCGMCRTGAVGVRLAGGFIGVGCGICREEPA